MEWLFAVVLRPFAALVLFVLAYYIARWVSRLIPEGPFKALLLRPISKRIRRCRRPGRR